MSRRSLNTSTTLTPEEEDHAIGQAVTKSSASHVRAYLSAMGQGSSTGRPRRWKPVRKFRMMSMNQTASTACREPYKLDRCAK